MRKKLASKISGMCSAAPIWCLLSAVFLLLLFPVLQISSPRSAPAGFGFASLLLLPLWFTHANRAREIHNVREIFDPRNYGHWPKRSLIAACALLTWIFLSAFWSPLPKLVIRDFAFIIALLILVPLVSRALALVGFRALFLLLSLGIVLGCIGLQSELLQFTSFHWQQSFMGIHDLNRNVILLALVFWPLLLARTAKSGWILFLVMVFLAITVALSLSESAKLTLLCAAILWMCSVFWKPVLRLSIVLMALSVLIFPLLMMTAERLQIEKIPSVASNPQVARYYIWQGYFNDLSGHWLLGHGARADQFNGTNEQVKIRHWRDESLPFRARHPHNFIVEIWYNFGALGAAFLAALLFSFGRVVTSWRRDEELVATLTMISVYMSTIAGASLFQGWFLASVGIAATVNLAFMHAHRDQQSS